MTEKYETLIPIGIEEHKLLELEILSYVSDFCEKNNLRYSLSDGTLLGAVRHKGFIPWDDDIDICMPRPDFEKLIELFDGGDKYRILGPLDPKARYFFAKIYNVNTVKIEDNRKGRNDVGGVDIDIFPIDGTSADEEEYCLLNQRITRMYYRQALVASGLRGTWKHFLQTAGFRVVYGNAQTIISRTVKLCWKHPFDCSEYVAFYDLFSPGWRIPVSQYNEFVRLDFEGKRFRCMKGYDAVLTMQYGDYMTPPPIEKQVTHHLNNVYWLNRSH